MSGIYQINIICTLRNKIFKNRNKFIIAYFNAFILSADFIILAKYTFQITAWKKYSTASLFATYARLLPKMECRSCNAEIIGALAKAEIDASVNIAMPWANWANHISALYMSPFLKGVCDAVSLAALLIDIP